MSQTSTVSVAHKGDVAWVTIDNPPVNATSTDVRAGLERAVAEVQGARVAVLQCAGRTFVAGGDMSEFDRSPELPHLPDVVQMIEDSPVPFVALMHGTVRRLARARPLRARLRAAHVRDPHRDALPA